MSPLHTDYRPKALKDIAGNKDIVAAVAAILARKSDWPHTWLFTGPSGSGKTTTARIVAASLGIADSDLCELNLANTRGIDTAREIQERMRLRPLGAGGARGWILDECFAKGTAINTSAGLRNIETIKSSDFVYTIDGGATVENVFINKVNLDRVVKLTFSNGSFVFTTKQHLFLTDTGWIEAGKIKNNNLLLFFSSDIMDHIISLKGGRLYALRNLWQKIYSKEKDSAKLFSRLFPKKSANGKYKAKNKTNVQDMFSRFLHVSWENSRILWFKMCGNWSWNRKYKTFAETQLQMVSTRIFNPTMFNQTILQSIMCQQMEKRSTGMESSTQDAGSKKKGIIDVQKNAQRQSEYIKTVIGKNESKQSVAPTGYCRKDQSDQSNETNQRNASRLERRMWRQRYIDKRTTTIARDLSRLADRSSYIVGQVKAWISNLLQGGYRQRETKNSNRGRWEWPSLEKRYAKGCKKNRNTSTTRLESIEIYQQGNNDEHFISIIDDKERSQGYVEFYDLQIAGHPSYFANGLAVHNCHAGTKDFWSAMLKPLEDVPEHVYFFLCTTDPQKLLPTVKTRCEAAHFKFESLAARQIEALLATVIAAEGAVIPKAVVDYIAENCAGSARAAVGMLDKVIDMPVDQMQTAVERAGLEQVESIELCRALIKGEKWGKVAAVIKGMGEFDAEACRQAVLGYCNTVLLSSKADDPGTNRAWLVYDSFREPLADRNGRSAITYQAYMAVMAK